VKKAEKSQRSAKQIEDRKWEKAGEKTMARWLSPAASATVTTEMKTRIETKMTVK
jgi:hypothetical protein